jgi:hypothetical protein
MIVTANKVMSTIRATFALDFGINVVTELVPSLHVVFPIGGSQLSQAGVLVSVLIISYEIYGAVQSFKLNQGRGTAGRDCEPTPPELPQRTFLEQDVLPKSESSQPRRA